MENTISSNTISQQNKEQSIDPESHIFHGSLTKASNTFILLCNNYPHIVEKIFSYLPTKECWNHFHDALQNSGAEPPVRHFDEITKTLQNNKYDTKILKKCEQQIFRKFFIPIDTETINYILELQTLHIITNNDNSLDDIGSYVTLVDKSNIFRDFSDLFVVINNRICFSEEMTPIIYRCDLDTNNSMVKKIIFPDSLFQNKYMTEIVFKKIMEGSNELFIHQNGNEKLLSALFIARLIGHFKERNFKGLDCNKINEIIQSYPLLVQTGKKMLEIFLELNT